VTARETVKSPLSLRPPEVGTRFAGTDAERGEPARQTFDGGGELAGREPYPLVRDARVVGRFLRAQPRDLANVHCGASARGGRRSPQEVGVEGVDVGLEVEHSRATRASAISVVCRGRITP